MYEYECPCSLIGELSADEEVTSSYLSKAIKVYDQGDLSDINNDGMNE